MEPEAGSQCLALKALGPPQPQFNLQIFVDPQDERYCFAISSGVPPNASPATEQIVVAVYGKPSARALSASGAPAPIASLPRFGRVTPGETVTWKVGKAGTELAGWIAAWSPSSSGTFRHVAAPWSTCALWRLGSDILREQAPDFREAKDPKNREVCEWP